jgi:hypothetical protein
VVARRFRPPKGDDIDAEVSLPALRAPGHDAKRFDPKREATVRGYVGEH